MFYGLLIASETSKAVKIGAFKASTIALSLVVDILHCCFRVF